MVTEFWNRLLEQVDEYLLCEVCIVSQLARLIWLEKLSAVRSKPPKRWQWCGKAASLPVHCLPAGQFLTPTPFLQHLLYVTVTDAVWLLTRLVGDLYILLTLHRGHQSSEDAEMKVQQHNKHIFLLLHHVADCQ